MHIRTLRNIKSVNLVDRLSRAIFGNRLQMSEFESGCCPSSVNGRIHFYSQTYHRLFPVDLDIEKVWEISLLQSDAIIAADVEVLTVAGTLSGNLFDTSESIWTRAISGAALVHLYSSNNMERIAVEKFIHQISLSINDEQYDRGLCEVITEYTNDDIVMISMYALMLFKRIQQRDLIKSVLESCINTLELCSIQSSSACSKSQDRICLSVLSALLSRGVLLNTTLCAVVETNHFGFLERLYDLFYLDSLSKVVSREQIAKRLITPIIQLIGNSDMVHSSTQNRIPDQMIDLTWSQCNRLARANEEDLQICSILLCALMSVPQLKSMDRLGKSDLWAVLSKCFLSSDTVVRKRAAFVMQLIPNTPTGRDNKISTDVIDERKKERKPKKALKSKKGFVDNSDQEATLESPPAIDSINFLGLVITLNSLSGLRPWWSDYLDIYGQIEGCTSMHLVDQIWPQLEHLCQLAASLDEDAQIFSDVSSFEVEKLDIFSYPVLNFNWVKGLLHILLQISIPGIRKAVLRRILSGSGTSNEGLVLSCSHRTITWLSSELFPLIDTVGFFSAYFIPEGVDVGCNGDTTFLQDSKINVLAHPGILMPSFISRLLRSSSVIDKLKKADNRNDKPLVNHLIQSIVHIVCGENGLHSLSAAKWIVRVFAEPSILALIPPCLGSLQLREMRAFFRGRLACSNGVVREHVLQGLLPLFLRGINSSEVSLEDLLLTVTGGSCFGFDRIVNNAVSFSSLKVAVLDCCMTKLLGNGTGCPLNELGGNYLALTYSIVTDRSTPLEDIALQIGTNVSPCYSTADEIDVILLSELERLCKEHLDTVSKLYSSPYLDVVSKQRVAINFLSGVIRSVVIAFNQLPDSSPVTNRVVLSSTPLRMMFPLPLLSIIQNCSGDLASYLSISLMSSLAVVASDVDRAPCNSSNVQLLIDRVVLLDECALILGSLLLLRRLCPQPVDTALSECPALSVILRTFDSLVAILSSAQSSCLSNILTVRCASILLDALQKSWPLPCMNNELLMKLVSSVCQLTTLLISITGPSSSAFRNFVAHVDRSKESTGNSPPFLLIDLTRITDCQFGRVSTMFVENRWAGIKSGLQLLVLAKNSSINSIVHSDSDEDASEVREAYQLFSLAIDQLDCCSMISLPDVLSCCLVVAKRFCANEEGEKNRRAALLIRLLDVAWLSTISGSAYTDVRAINSFIRLAFDTSILRSLEHRDIRRYYDQVEALGLKNRPHIMQSLVCTLCASWTIDPPLSVPFFSLLPRLLLYREPRQDDHNVPDNTGHESASFSTTDITSRNSDNDISTSNDAPSIAGICRFTVLIFLENCMNFSVNTDVACASVERKDQHSELLTQCLGILIEDLVALNFRDDFIQAAMIGSDLYGQKLRCWQSMCVLTKYMSEVLLTSILESYFTILTHSAGHSIRVHLELFGAAMAIKFPTVMMPRLLQALREFNHTQQTLCSIFVILGHRIFDACEGLGIDVTTAKAVVSHLLPWTACGAGLPRTIAQLLMHSLIPIVLSETEESCPSQSDGDIHTGHAYLKNIMQYLEQNRDSSKGIPKQRKFFTEFHPLKQCSVRGLTLLGLDNTGEVVAPHILTFLADALKAEAAMEREQFKGKSSDALFSQCTIENKTMTSITATLQTKIVPFDDLQLNLESEALSRQQNAAGRKRQDVVVCASLIDKVTNLAGIARTCEIFAVKELVLSNLGIVQTDTFQGIAVSCDQWLPMNEVPVYALTSYLQGMRRKGYTILGLEQTDNSNILGETSQLPSKCVLLLGREKEGIPVELLQEIDFCLEIPQYGVIRSLNVHVSAALAIWEITKINKKYLDSGNMIK